MNKKLFGALLLGSILVRVSPTNAELTADNRDAKAVYPLVQGQKLTIKLDQSDMSAGINAASAADIKVTIEPTAALNQVIDDKTYTATGVKAQMLTMRLHSLLLRLSTMRLRML